MAVNIKNAPKPVPTPAGHNFSKHLGTPAVKPAEGFVGTTQKEGATVVGEHHKSFPLTAPPVSGEVAVVKVEGRRTINLGNYNSVQVSVGIEWPTSKDDLEAGYEFASDWVSKKMIEATSALEG